MLQTPSRSGKPMAMPSHARPTNRYPNGTGLKRPRFRRWMRLTLSNVSRETSGRGLVPWHKLPPLTSGRVAIVAALAGAGVIDPLVLGGQMLALAVMLILWGCLGDVSRETSQDHVRPLESQRSPEPAEYPA